MLRKSQTHARFSVTFPIVRWISKFRDVRSKSKTETVWDFGYWTIIGLKWMSLALIARSPTSVRQENEMAEIYMGLD